MILPNPRIPTWITAACSILAFSYGVIMVFALHRHEEAWAFVVGVSFAIYPIVPKLPEEPDEVINRVWR